MQADRVSILTMLEEGKINAQEASQLLEALEGDAQQDKKAQVTEKVNPRIEQMSHEGRKLRVKVNGKTEKSENINVNVSIPLALARVVDNIIDGCLPNEARSAMKEHGIDISAIRLGELVSTLEDLDEDLVNVDIDDEKDQLKVRVYVD